MIPSLTGRRILLVIFVLATAHALLYMLHDGVGLSRWQKSGFLESRLAHLGDSTSVFRKAIPNDFVSPPFPVAGDTVLQVDGKPMTIEHHVQYGPAFKYNIAPLPADQPLSVTYLHRGDTLNTFFAMHPPTTQLKWFLIIVDLLRHLIVLSMLFVGGWGIYSRGDSVVVQVFALYCLSRAGEAIGAYFIPLSYGLVPHEFMYPLNMWVPNLLSAGVFSYWLHLQFVFPRPLKWIERHPALAYSLCYIPTVQALGYFLSSRVPAFKSFVPAFVSDGQLMEITSWIFLLAGVAILVVRYNTTTDRLERRQLRLFIGGTAVGLVASAVLSVLYAYWFEWYDSTPYVDLVGSAIVYVATLLGPVSFVYAFRRFRLMDIEGKLRRGTRFALVTGVFLAVVGISVIALSRVILDWSRVDSLTVSLALGFGLSLGVIPAQRRINAFVEKRLYPERARLRMLLRNFLDAGAIPVDQHEFWRDFTELLRDGMKVKSVHCLRVDEESSAINSESAIARYLLATRRALVVDEATAAEEIASDTAAAAWLKEKQIGMLLPLVLRDRLLAIAAIGLRIDDEDYDSEELQILNQHALQVAVAAENLRLLEENFDKKRMELELSSARTTQENLLPKQIPQLEGLEIAAICQFCTEVAGDYYDVLQLDQGHTCIAIGDVSGKGASASLLMASLQSSLNTAIPFGIALPDIVARINNVVCRNTSPEQFITFFIGIFDPKAKTFTYVNAGHDAPIITRADGQQALLDVGGVILGIVPDLPYTSATVKLNAGDTLFLYTDGVREAWNADCEEFGMDNLSAEVAGARHLPPQEQVLAVQKSVIAFHGSDRFDDDFTLVVVKAT